MRILISIASIAGPSATITANTLITTSTITATATLLAALLGVWLTQQGNERQKRMEIAHAKSLKEIELQAQRDKDRRAEKRTIYQQTLEYSRGALEYWETVGSFDMKLPKPVPSILEEAKQEATVTNRKRAALKSGLEMDASSEVVQLFHKLEDAITQCRYAYIHEYQDRNISGYDRDSIAFNEVRAAVARALNQDHARDKYLTLRDRIREELDWKHTPSGTKQK